MQGSVRELLSPKTPEVGYYITYCPLSPAPSPSPVLSSPTALMPFTKHRGLVLGTPSLNSGSHVTTHEAIMGRDSSHRFVALAISRCHEMPSRGFLLVRGELSILLCPEMVIGSS